MRNALLVVLILATGCKDKKQAEPAPKPTTEPAPAVTTETPKPAPPPTGDSRGVAELQAELDKTTLAIAAAESLASDMSQAKELRIKAKGGLPALLKEKAAIEALIAAKSDQR